MELANFEHREQTQKTCSLRVAIAGVMAARRFRIKARISRNGSNTDYVRIDIDYTVEATQVQQSDQTSAMDAQLHKALKHLVADGNLEKLSELGGAHKIARQLNTSLQNGISPSCCPTPTPRSDQAHLLEAELEKRRARFGKNTLSKKRGKTFWHILWDSCRSNVILIVLTMLGILLVGLGIKIQGPKQGWCIGASFILFQFADEAVNALAEYWLSKELEKLSDQEDKDIRAHVLRCGKRCSVRRDELVVSDLVELRSGDQIPADGLWVQGDCFKIKECSDGCDFHTHTTSNTTRDEAYPFLSCGYFVEAGHGLMLVTAVGRDTMWGNKRASMSGSCETTPLQMRLSNYGTLLRNLGLSVAMLYVMSFLPLYFSGHYKSDSLGASYFKAGKTRAIDAIHITFLALLSNGLTLVVAVLPTGLPLAVKLTLAYSMPRMLIDNARVRKVASCETLGSVTTICTGIRTLAPIYVDKFWMGELFEAGPTDSVLDFSHGEDVSSLVFEGVAQNADDSTQGPDLRSSSPDKAALEWCLKAGMQSAEAERAKASVLKKETSSPEKQRAGVAVCRKSDGRLSVHWKGAAEDILSSCSNWMDATTGEPKAMTDTKRQELTKLIKHMGDASLHCVAFAYCEVVPAAALIDGCWPHDRTLPETDLTLLILMGVKDCRPGVKEAVEMVKKGGVKVMMVTGENPETARTIAKECGILVEDRMQEQQVVEGPTFRNWGPMEMRDKLPQLAVLARASPQDKRLLVYALQTNLREVVAFTGDKANEAPALQEAHVGLSMGGRVQAAIKSSDIVILDNSFISIVKVVEWGRGIHTNIQSFLQFQFTISIATAVVSLAGMGVLWVDLLMGNLGVLALAMEPPSRALMLRRPIPREGPLITNAMWCNVALQAAYQVVVLGNIQFADATLNRSFIFNTFVFCQIFNAVNARRFHRKNIFEGILRSPLFAGSMATIVILQIFMVEVMGKFVSTSVPLRWDLWLYCLGFAAASWLIAFVGKFLPIPPTLVPSSSYTTPLTAYMSA